ncbi:MAG: PCYCGC domain-containing protein [Thaumarchaeota archaeon]|nr:PCYCGC domain-containing protein [Nitrososphaerota archaeon]MCL5317377.1 PCYCGC domain-containing protein [Nitrososphaerota archaeon]
MPKPNFKTKKKEKNSSNLLGIIFVIAIVAVGAAIFYVTATRNQVNTGGIELPKYAYTTDQVTQAYVASKQLTNVFKYMPCYCGCGTTGHPVPHNNLHDCFIQPNGDWNQHAAGCSTCVDIATTVWSKLRDKSTPYDIRQMIDREYSNGNYPPSTPTPMPPQ